MQHIIIEGESKSRMLYFYWLDICLDFIQEDKHFNTTKLDLIECRLSNKAIGIHEILTSY